MDKERNIYLWYVILAGIEGILGVFMVLFFSFSDPVKETDIEDKYLDPSDKNSVEYKDAQIKNKQINKSNEQAFGRRSIS